MIVFNPIVALLTVKVHSENVPDAPASQKLADPTVAAEAVKVMTASDVKPVPAAASVAPLGP